MLPLRDHHRLTIFPFITYALIAANVFIFFYMISLGERGLANFVSTYALIPADIINFQNLFTLLTSMFLHGSIGHLIGNMLFLHIFGDNLEEIMGHIKYLVFYLLTGLGASLLQIIIDPTSSIPNLGASGAIAGLMGGYVLLFPKNKIDVIIPLGFTFSQTTLPAFTMLFYWIAIQFISGIGSLGITGQGGVAYFAHIGGFIAGLLLVNIFANRSKIEMVRSS